MKIAIVTGASSGLGREFVRLLDAQQKYDEIWVIARRKERLLELAKKTKTPVIAVPLDLGDKKSIRTLAGYLKEETPNVGMLINAAGYGKIGNYKEVSIEDSEGMIDLNCRAAVAVTQTVLPYMKKGAYIMQICSTAVSECLCSKQGIPLPLQQGTSNRTPFKKDKRNGSLPILDQRYGIYRTGKVRQK